MIGATRRFDAGIQLLALCPLLAVSDTVVSAIGIAAAVMIVVPFTTMLMLAIRRWLPDEATLPVGILVIATFIASVELLMRAWFNDLFIALGPFVALIAANLVIVDHFRSRASTSRDQLVGALSITIGIGLTLLLLGVARELVGRGSLLHGAGVLGSWARGLESTVFRVDMGFLLAMLPPGAFISFGLLIAARNWLAQKRS
jgi:Na+-translocating ferredoxin:NAD+ oxidoreductase subunit E